MTPDPPLEERDCRTQGHVWTNSTHGLTPLHCLYCDAGALLCPDCGGWPASPERAEVCAHCHDSGVVEICEITKSDLAYLTLTAHRFRFLLRVYAEAGKAEPADAIRELDVLMTAAGLGESHV